LRNVPLKKAFQALLCFLFLAAPLVFWGGTVSIVDIKVFLVKIVVLLLCLLVCFGAFVKKALPVARWKIILVILGYGLWQAVRYAFSASADPGVLSSQWFNLLFCLCLLLSPLERDDLLPVLTALTAAALAASLYNVADHLDWFSFSTLKAYSDGTGASTLGHKNFASSFLLMCVPFPFYLAWRAKDFTQRLLWLFAAFLIVFGMILTFSRGALAALLISSMVALLVRARGKKLFENRTMLIILSALFVLLLVLVPRDFYRTLWHGIKQPETISPLRVDIYRSAVKMIKERPVAGFGTGSFFHKYPEYKGEYALWKVEKGTYIKHAHNEYLEILVDGGLIQLLLFLVIMTMFFSSLLKQTRGAWFLALLTAAAAILIFGAFTVALRYLFVSCLFWMIVFLGFVDSAGTKYYENRMVRPLAAIMMALIFFAGFKTTLNFLSLARQKTAYDRFRAGRTGSALSMMNRLEESRPQDPSVLYEKGFMLYTLGRYFEAEQAYKKVVDKSPYYMDVRYHLALSLKKQKKYREALAHIKEALYRNWNRDEELYIHYAECEYYIREWEEALKTLDWMLQLFPQSKKGRFLREYITESMEKRAH
jgi:O-antigen ligase